MPLRVHVHILALSFLVTRVPWNEVELITRLTTSYPTTVYKEETVIPRIKSVFIRGTN